METDQSLDTPDPNTFTDPSPNPAIDSELATICDVLKTHGVKRVIVQYEGCGDSGGVADVEYLPEGIAIPGSVDGNLRDVAVEYCPDGYENNDGGYGTLIVYPMDGLAELEHFDRFEDSQEMDTSPADLPEILKQRLVSLGVTKITGNFDGSGDSGQIEQLNVVPDSITMDPALANEVDDFLLDQLSGGWENNAGGFGDFTIDVSSGEVGLNAYWRIEDANAQTISWNWRQPWPTHTITR